MSPTNGKKYIVDSVIEHFSNLAKNHDRLSWESAVRDAALALNDIKTSGGTKTALEAGCHNLLHSQLERFKDIFEIEMGIVYTNKFMLKHNHSGASESCAIQCVCTGIKRWQKNRRIRNMRIFKGIVKCVIAISQWRQAYYTPGKKGFINSQASFINHKCSPHVPDGVRATSTTM